MLGRIAKHLLPEIAVDTLGSISLYRNAHGTLPHAASALEEEIPPPRYLAQMIDVVEKLAEGIEFVRVDLYHTPERIAFGEMTATPGARLAKFSSPSFERYLGSFW